MMLIASCSYPTKLMLRWILDLMFAPIIKIFDSIFADTPLERLDVLGCFANLEHHVQHGAIAKESSETRVFIKAIQFVKITAEAFITNQGPDGKVVKTYDAPVADEHPGEALCDLG